MSVTVTVLLLASCGGDGGEEAAIRQVFQRYRSAILARDGSIAANLVTQNTLEYYENIRAVAAEAGTETIAQRSMFDRLFIALLRVEVGPRELREMTGQELFVLAVDRGLIGEEDVRASEIGEVTIEGDVAMGEAISDGRASGLSWRFAREGNGWRLDLTSVFPVANLAIKQVAQREGLSEDALIFQVVESVTGQRVSDEIWEEPRGKAA
jgi:hypothetical protein